MDEKMVRMSFTVPPQLREDLSYLSGRLGVTKSAFVSLLLGESVADLRRLMEDIPDDPQAVDIRRFRGASRDMVERRVGNLQRITEDDLFGVQ